MSEPSGRRRRYLLEHPEGTIYVSPAEVQAVLDAGLANGLITPEAHAAIRVLDPEADPTDDLPLCEHGQFEGPADLCDRCAGRVDGEGALKPELPGPDPRLIGRAYTPG